MRGGEGRGGVANEKSLEISKSNSKPERHPPASDSILSLETRFDTRHAEVCRWEKKPFLTSLSPSALCVSGSNCA